MDDLIILIVKALVRAFSGPAIAAPPRSGKPTPLAVPPPIRQQRRAVGTRIIRGKRITPAPPPLPVTKPKSVKPAPALVPDDVILPGHAGSTTQIGAQPKSNPVPDALHQFLTPAMLRKQFILTEILQKPLALREQS